MKKNVKILLLFVLFVLSATSYATTNPKDIIKKGTKLLYEVNYLGTNYEFIITVKDDSKDYSFDCKMSDLPDKNSSLNISITTFQSATGIFNYFTNANNNLDNECSIVLSKKMYDSFKGNGSMEIVTDKKNNISSIFGNSYDHTQNFGYKNDNSNEFNCVTVNDGKDYEITYVNDANFPLIIELKLEWTLKLKNIYN